MKSHGPTIVLILAAVLSVADADAACTPPGGPSGPIETDTCVDADDADTPWLYLALDLGGEACPAATGWAGSKLFGSGSLPPGLKSYCRYEALSGESSVAALEAASCPPAMPGDNCLIEFGPDSQSLTLLSTQAIEGLTVDDFSAQFLAQAGAVGPLPAAPQNIRLAVIDTEPSGPMQDRNGPGIADHGYTLLNLIRRTLCPDAGPCGVQLDSELGLPLELCSLDPTAFCQCNAAGPDGVCRTPVRGGFVGTQSDLADAIYTAVDDWVGSSVQRLVINLSVGWEPLYGGAPPLGSQSIAVRAVASALQDASCRGAIVIAAAGNRAPGPETFTGPLYPAAWEQLAAPDETACHGLLGMLPNSNDFPPLGSGVYRPLVYAVGAVNHADDRVEGRPGAEPRLVAFGDHAVTETVDTMPEPTATLTGTSVGAAVVSSAAAAAWYYIPGAPAYAIMEQLYDKAGDGVGRTADFCLGGGCSTWPVKRINVCETVNEVCPALNGGACPTFTCPTDLPVVAPVPVDALFTAFAADPIVDLSTFSSSAPVPACAQNYVLHWVGGVPPTVPCPHLQYYGIQVTPWTDGQPSGQACPGCIDSFASPGNLFLEVAAEFQETLEDVTLLCGDDAYRLPGTLDPGDRTLVTQIPETCETQNLRVAFRTMRNGVHKASVLSASLKVSDRDDDGIQDAVDNCVFAFNPLQLDTDGDDIGNRCDGDFNNDCETNVIDLGIFRTRFFTSDPLADLNGDGIVNTLDLGLFKSLFFESPGPSGVPNLCSG